jgi:NADH-quinone oxidoreductase subunit N
MDLTNSYPLLFGLSLIIISLGFKVGAVPMQLWIPDVYQGAPTPITAFLSIASKAAGFGVALVILQPFLASDTVGGNVQLILIIMAAATLLYGNLSALAQTNFKRLLAYSSIAHAGFLLLALSVSDFQTIKFYLATYLIMTFAGFFILNLIRVQDNSDEIDGFDGLGKRNPRLALALTITMAAMAGVPLTAGFWGKLLVFKSIVGVLPWVVIVIAFVAAAAGFYYYFKVIRAIYWHKPANEKPLIIPCISKYAIIILTAAIIVVGVYPKAIECLIGG